MNQKPCIEKVTMSKLEVIPPKVVKCPKCHKEIDYLIEWCPEYVPYYFRLIDGKPDEEAADEEAECIGSYKINTDYCCPECREILTTDSDQAVKILSGEVKL